jgi:P27 family predicted phage terminase small subunit
MKQRGRKSRTSLSVVPEGPRLVSSSPPLSPINPPPPPDDLEEPERVIWRDIVAEWRGPRLSYAVLLDALRAHQTARKCSEVIAVEGMTVEGRDGQTKAHPLLAVERSAIASYQRQLKTLGIKF